MNLVLRFVYFGIWSCLLFEAEACDICGNYMCITPYDNKSSISFLHRYRVFNGYRNYQETSRFFPHSAYRVQHGDSHGDSLLAGNRTYSSNDFESYKVFECRFKYFITQRLELNVFIPLQNNKSKTNNILNRHTGLGDISLNTGFHFITPKADEFFRHKLIVGVGMKLPTGNHFAHDQNGNRLPFEMQPGSGSLDGFGYVNYMFVANNLGANISVNYKVNGSNNYHEKLKNSHNHYVSVFYKIKHKELIVYPSLQANYEYTKGLAIHFRLLNNTQVNSLLLGPGLDVYYKSFSFNTSWQFTAFETVRDGNLKSVGRISFGINYNITKKESN